MYKKSDFFVGWITISRPFRGPNFAENVRMRTQLRMSIFLKPAIPPPVGGGTCGVRDCAGLSPPVGGGTCGVWASTDANPACAPLKRNWGLGRAVGGLDKLLGAWISNLDLRNEIWTLDKKSGPWIRILGPWTSNLGAWTSNLGLGLVIGGLD